MEDRHSTGPPVGLIERVPSQPHFHPSSHEVVNPRSPGRTSVNIDVNLAEEGRRSEREITPGSPRRDLIRDGSDGD